MKNRIIQVGIVVLFSFLASDTPDIGNLLPCIEMVSGRQTWKLEALAEPVMVSGWTSEKDYVSGIDDYYIRTEPLNPGVSSAVLAVETDAACLGRVTACSCGAGRCGMLKTAATAIYP